MLSSFFAFLSSPDCRIVDLGVDSAFFRGPSMRIALSNEPLSQFEIFCNSVVLFRNYSRQTKRDVAFICGKGGCCRNEDN